MDTSVRLLTAVDSCCLNVRGGLTNRDVGNSIAVTPDVKVQERATLEIHIEVDERMGFMFKHVDRSARGSRLDLNGCSSGDLVENDRSVGPNVRMVRVAVRLHAGGMNLCNERLHRSCDLDEGLLRLAGDGDGRLGGRSNGLNCIDGLKIRVLPISSNVEINEMVSLIVAFEVQVEKRTTLGLVDNGGWRNSSSSSGSTGGLFERVGMPVVAVLLVIVATAVRLCWRAALSLDAGGCDDWAIDSGRTLGAEGEIEVNERAPLEVDVEKLVRRLGDDVLGRSRDDLDVLNRGRLDVALARREGLHNIRRATPATDLEIEEPTRKPRAEQPGVKPPFVVGVVVLGVGKGVLGSTLR